MGEWEIGNVVSQSRWCHLEVVPQSRVSQSRWCRNQGGVTVNVVSQARWSSQLRWCHTQGGVTVKVVSQSRWCHSQGCVTVELVSQSSWCHSQGGPLTSTKVLTCFAKREEGAFGCTCIFLRCLPLGPSAPFLVRDDDSSDDDSSE